MRTPTWQLQARLDYLHDQQAKFAQSKNDDTEDDEEATEISRPAPLIRRPGWPYDYKRHDRNPRKRARPDR